MRTSKSTAAAAAPSRHAGKRRPERSSSASTRVTRWTLAPEIEAEIAEIAAACGCELIHAEWKGGVLRLVLDRPPAPADIVAAPATAPPAGPPAGPSAGPEVAGVSLGDCEQVAKQTSALLDVLDFGNGHYLLEVSSPGLDRQLYRPSDYQRFLGRLARVTYHEPASSAEPGLPRRRTVVGRLAELRPPSAGSGGAAGSGASDAGEVTLVDDRTCERLTLKLEDIRMARLEVEL